MMLLAYRPSFCAYFSNAAVLYQPAVAVRLVEAGRSNAMPMVWVEKPNAKAIRVAKPYPVEQPMTSALVGPVLFGKAWIVRICSSTFFSHPTGCAVVQINPLTFGSMIIVAQFLPNFQLIAGCFLFVRTGRMLLGLRAELFYYNDNAQPMKEINFERRKMGLTNCRSDYNTWNPSLSPVIRTHLKPLRIVFDKNTKQSSLAIRNGYNVTNRFLCFGI
jgi:hypothetical protein